MKFISIILFFLAFNLQGQSTYIGLQEIANIDAPQQAAINGNYWPKFQIIDNMIYVPTKDGIYRKHLRTMSDTLWNSYAFNGIPISDFVKNNDEIIGITNKINDSLIVYSNNAGLSHVFRNNSHFIYPGLNNSIHQIAHNSTSFDKVLVSHSYGISMSLDKGRTWTLLSNYSPEYQYRFVDFHPVNSQKLFSTGENGFYTSYVYSSFDGGNSWNNINSVFNNCTHVLAFHPTNEDIYIIGGEGRIAKSADSGATWTTQNLTPYLYIYQIKFDANDNNVVYASGGINGINDTIYFLKSTNAGDSWNIVYQENINGEDVGAILDFEFYNGGVIFMTKKRGLFYLTNNLLGIEQDLTMNKVQLSLFPNPTIGIINVSSNDEITKAQIFNNVGQELKSFPIKAHQGRINLENFCSGVYYLKFLIKNQYFTRKVVKH